MKKVYSGCDVWEEYGQELQEMFAFTKPEDAKEVCLTIREPGSFIDVSFGLGRNDKKHVGLVNDFVFEQPSKYRRFAEVFCIPEQTISLTIVIPIMYPGVPCVHCSYHPVFEVGE